MKYLTKEWLELVQKTELYYGMRVNKYAYDYSEAVFLRLYKIREREFINTQKMVCDSYLNDIIIINTDKPLIENYNSTPLFDEAKCKEQFRLRQIKREKSFLNKFRIAYITKLQIRVYLP